ncbi:oligopeptide transport system substrate-binding protein [Evansella caseinilytica]|uniref:Oligopeptide transport system substrate-binding protein n=1 Tax=Evansella caseinilytica TaxID=1503961 RepID=A0A1H3UH30_9BACI|nr:peptide ABC transporter substrate-binding protein [Evansella caseinilytica]SDZ61694.1 oligopeptide transport system substrate-binding protein [Evansella caseinilytica]
MKKQFGQGMLLIMLIICAVLAGCNFDSEEGVEAEPGSSEEENKEQSTADEQAGGQVLKVAASAEIPTMDSVHAHDTIAFTVLNNVMEGLYRLGEDSNPVLGMAESHEESADGLVHTFTLRDAAWSNGTAVTADDFEYAWKRLMADEGHYASMMVNAGVLHAQDIIEGEKGAGELGVTAVDDKTLEVTLEMPNPLFTTLLTFPVFLPQNEAFVEEQGEQYALEAENVLYNGPFVLAEWNHDQNWLYKKNPDYWDADAVTLEEIQVNVVKETSTGVNLYETGELDRIGLSAAYVDEYSSSDEFQIIPRAGIIFVRMNTTHEVLGNANVRRAFDMVIDKEGLANVILNDGSVPLYGHVPENFSLSPEGVSFRELNGDFNKGTAEEAAEYFTTGLEEAGAEELTVSLLSSDAESHRKIAEYLKDQFETKLPGVTIDLQMVPFQQRLDQEKALAYDMVISTWGPDYNDPMTFIDMFVTDGSANRTGYSSAEFDSLVEQAKAEDDPSARYQLMLDAEKVLLEKDALIAPLVQNADAILQREKVKNIVEHPSGPDFTYKWTYIEE